jgi:hypothetical protein
MYQSIYYDRESYQYYLRDDKRGWKVFNYQPTCYVADVDGELETSRWY